MRTWHVAFVGTMTLIGSALADDPYPSTCNDADMCCTKWAIDLDRSDGTRWGLIEKNTFREAVDELTRQRENEERACRFLGQSYPCSALSYEHASAPRCAGARKPAQRDDCAAQTAQRIDALAQRVEERVASTAVIGGQVDALRMRAEGALGRRMSLPGTNVAGVSVGYQDSLAKLQRLRRTLADVCVPASAPLQERMWGGSISRGRMKPDLPPNMTAELDELEAALAPPRIGRFKTTTLKRPSRVLIAGGGPAHIVLSSNVALANDVVVPQGTYLVASAYVDGDKPVFGGVTESTGWQGAPDALVFSATVAGMQKTLVLIPIGDKDGDNVADDRDACADRKGTLPNGCPADTDGDGFADDQDGCIAQPGKHNGCPVQVAQPPPQQPNQGAVPTDVGSCEQFAASFDEFGQQMIAQGASCRNMAGHRLPNVRCRVFDMHKPRAQVGTPDVDRIPGIADDHHEVTVRCMGYFREGAAPQYVPCCVK